MAEISVTVANSGALVNAGQVVEYAEWTSGFDHAALVTAKRSRSDGADFHLWHTTYGPVGWTGIL